MTPPDDDASRLAAEQMKHAIDLLRADLNQIEFQLVHSSRLFEQRLNQLEQESRDHEQRLRETSEGVTQMKVLTSLASGSSSLMSLAALIKAFLGL